MSSSRSSHGRHALAAKGGSTAAANIGRGPLTAASGQRRICYREASPAARKTRMPSRGDYPGNAASCGNAAHPSAAGQGAAAPKFLHTQSMGSTTFRQEAPGRPAQSSAPPPVPAAPLAPSPAAPAAPAAPISAAGRAPAATSGPPAGSGQAPVSGSAVPARPRCPAMAARVWPGGCVWPQARSGQERGVTAGPGAVLGAGVVPAPALRRGYAARARVVSGRGGAIRAAAISRSCAIQAGSRCLSRRGARARACVVRRARACVVRRARAGGGIADRSRAGSARRGGDPAACAAPAPAGARTRHAASVRPASGTRSASGHASPSGHATASGSASASAPVAWLPAAGRPPPGTPGRPAAQSWCLLAPPRRRAANRAVAARARRVDRRGRPRRRQSRRQPGAD